MGIYLGEISKLKSAGTWEKFPSGDDPSPPYPTWDFFELGNFLKWNEPTPKWNLGNVKTWEHFETEGPPPKSRKQVENGKLLNKINYYL